MPNLLALFPPSAISVFLALIFIGLRLIFFKELLVFGYGFGHCSDYCFQWEQGTTIQLDARELVALVIKIRRNVVRTTEYTGKLKGIVFQSVEVSGFFTHLITHRTD